VKVLLLHNPTSGEAHPSQSALVRAFEDAGHTVLYQSTKEEDWERALDAPVDVMIAAGGDGTVRRVATVLAGQTTETRAPLAILPIGTANNIARTLGVNGTLVELAAALEQAHPTRLAVGRVRAEWGENRFVESAGVGLFAGMIRASLTRNRKRRPTSVTGKPVRPRRHRRLKEGITRLRRTLATTRPMEVRVKADGHDLSGNYILVEALNIASIGPCIDLAPTANFSDNVLELVLAQWEDRPALETYLEQIEAGETAKTPLISRRVHRLELSWSGGIGHVDDELWPPEDQLSAGTIEVTVEIQTLLPLLLPS
jgi:diacylglycerol kinase (ATP)